MQFCCHKGSHVHTGGPCHNLWHVLFMSHSPYEFLHLGGLWFFSVCIFIKWENGLTGPLDILQLGNSRILVLFWNLFLLLDYCTILLAVALSQVYVKYGAIGEVLAVGAQNTEGTGVGQLVHYWHNQFPGWHRQSHNQGQLLSLSCPGGPHGPEEVAAA